MKSEQHAEVSSRASQSVQGHLPRVCLSFIGSAQPKPLSTKAVWERYFKRMLNCYRSSGGIEHLGAIHHLL